MYACLSQHEQKQIRHSHARVDNTVGGYLCKSSDWPAHCLVSNPDEAHGNLVSVQCFMALFHEEVVHLKKEEEGAMEEEGQVTYHSKALLERLSGALFKTSDGSVVAFELDSHSRS